MSREIKTIYLNSKGNFIPVGRLAIDRDESLIYFSYEKEWRQNGFALSFDLPLSPRVFSTGLAVPSFGFLYDLTPGAAGRKLALEGEKKALDIIDLLIQVPEELRVGALVFSTKTEPPITSKSTPALFADMERLIASNRHFQDIDLLYRASAALPGARFKLSCLNSKNINVISKFNIPNQVRNLVVFESAALQMAASLGMDAIDTRVINFRGVCALLSERFDRDPAGNRLPFASAQALLAVGDEAELSYVNLADILNAAGSRPQKDLPELFSRMVFSMAVGNTNDAASNIGFLRDAYGWRLSPMYGVTPVAASTTRRHHATGVTPENNTPDIGEAIAQARYFGLTEAKARQRALEISNFVSQNWRRFATAAGADAPQIDNMKKAFEPLDF